MTKFTEKELTEARGHLREEMFGEKKSKLTKRQLEAVGELAKRAAERLIKAFPAKNN